MFKIFFKKKIVSYIFRKLKKLIKKNSLHPIQDHKTKSGYNYLYLGTDYGGWNFVDEDCLNGCTIISAGLGEDGSFDIEFATKYNATVIIVDPTPRAIKHYEEIINSLGRSSSVSYSNDGKQPAASYDLSKLKKTNLQLIKKALWNKNEKLNFYEPQNPQHVSHSIINYQNNYSKTSKFIEVESISMDKLLKDLKLKNSNFQLLKLDIEGAEIEVINHCLNNGIMPRQILVEFDELNAAFSRGVNRVNQVNDALLSNGYTLLWTNGKADFLYYRLAN